jgi:sarcosine oxidase
MRAEALARAEALRLVGAGQHEGEVDPRRVRLELRELPGARERDERPAVLDRDVVAELGDDGRETCGERVVGHVGEDRGVMRVAIVGAGVMGAATAWALAERGVRATLYEQFDLDHTRGSSHGRSRIFRLAYPEPEWVELAEEALPAWRELERTVGHEVLQMHGLVEVCTDESATSRDVLAAHGIEHVLLDPEKARSHGVALPRGWVALWQPEAGVVLAEAARNAFLEVARPEIRRERVESLDDLDAEVVVVTAGAWITKLVPDVPVHVTRETIAYFARDGDPTPSIVEVNAATRQHAMYALHDPVHGLKAGAHHAGHAADPDTEEPANGDLVEAIAGWVRERLPDVDPTPLGAETCLYTSTDDERFVLERRGRLVVGSPCSGHGFKFAPAIGRRLAALTGV